MISVSPKGKKRGRPPKGTDPIVGIRMSPELRMQIEALAFRQKDSPTLSAAIRQLVERALVGGGKPLTITLRPKGTKKDAPVPIVVDAGEGNGRSPLRSDRWRVRRPRRQRSNRDLPGAS
jgi:hypothetical protein